MTLLPISKLRCCSWVHTVCAGQLCGKTAGKHEHCCPLVAITHAESCGDFLSIPEGPVGAVMQFLTMTGEKVLTELCRQKLGKHGQQRRGSRCHRGQGPWASDLRATQQSKGSLTSRGHQHGHCKWVLLWERLETWSKIIKDYHMSLRDMGFLETPADACLVQIRKTEVISK